MGRRALWVAALLLLPTLLVLPGASACVAGVGVPCGRIYPIILMQVEDKASMYNLTLGEPVEIAATLTYKFDMANEGYTAVNPLDPITIGFEFPRKPDWAELSVEPERIVVDVNNPTNVQPDPTNPASPQATYVFTVPIKITARLTGQAILRDGYDYHKLLVFAKSTESGLYQAGYGIKEIRVIPENALHESDVAGAKDVFTAVPLPPLAIPTLATSFAGTTVSVEAAQGTKYWEPTELVATIDPAPAGRAVLAVHDEAGALVAQTAPLDASSGQLALNVTFVRPGLHTATVTLLPSPGTMTPPMTYALDFEPGAREGEGWLFPKAYTVTSSEIVPAPAASHGDPLAQWERDIPFYAFDTAQSASASLTLTTPGLAPAGTGLTNVQFAIHAPDGKQLIAGSVDPVKKLYSIRVGTLPEEGWYVVRVKGVGVPALSAYDVRIEVAYAAQHQARNLADGVADATGDLLSTGGRNMTLPTQGLAVWAPGDLTPLLEAVDSASHQVTVVDANGTPVYASGVRGTAVTFTPPAPGSYRAFAYAEPDPTGTPYSPVVRAFAFDVGAGQVTIADKFRVEDAWEAPAASPQNTFLGFQAVPLLAGAGEVAPDVTNGRAELVDAEGAAASDAPGTYFLRVVAANPTPQPESVPATLELAYASPQSLAGPDAQNGPAEGGLPVPGLAIGLLLLVAGLVAVGVALARRR